MYMPSINREDDPVTLLAFMQRYSFISLVSQHDDTLMASHIPVVVSKVGESILIRGHLAKANPQWQSLTEQECLILFTGPHAYISPKHYDTEQSVPTWNYTAVHAYGRPETVHFQDDPAALEALVMALVEQEEAAYRQQWQGLSQKYKEGMMQGIVGFEVKVTKLEGKYKLSQNKSVKVQKQVTLALGESKHALDRDTSELMLKRLS